MNHYVRSVRGPEDGVIRRPETKSFILTSEFWVAAGAAAAVLLAAYAFDDITKTSAWRFFAWIAIAYIVSRGIAKAGSQRDYRPDPVRSLNGVGEEHHVPTPSPVAAGEAERPRPTPRQYQPGDGLDVTGWADSEP